MVRKVLYYLLPISMLMIGGVLFLFNHSTTTAQQTVNVKWEYREFTFQTPVSFGSTFSEGYYNNGVLAYPNSSDATVGILFNYLGSQGWELVSNLNNQYFIFKRPTP